MPIVHYPTITGVSPNYGSCTAPTSVNLTGQYFTNQTITAVMFGAYASPSFYVGSDTQIACVSPYNKPAGTVDITLVWSGGSSTIVPADQFSYETTPTVTGVSSGTGPLAGGTSVTITGTSFLAATAVKFGSTNAASFTINSDTSITAVSPAGSAGTVDITVTSAYGTSTTSSADQFTYSNPTPTISSASPPMGSTDGGTSVTLTGTHFTGATSVTFDGIPCVFTIGSDTSITATTPPHALGTVSIAVTNSYGTGTLVNGYWYSTGTLVELQVSQGQSDAMSMAEYTFDGNLVGYISSADYMKKKVLMLPDASGVSWPVFCGIYVSSDATYDPADTKMHLKAYDYALFPTKQVLDDWDLSLLPVPQQTAITNNGAYLVWTNLGAGLGFLAGYQVVGAASGAHGRIINVATGTNTLTIYPCVGAFVNGENLQVGGTTYAQANGNSTVAAWSTIIGTIYPETWVKSILGNNVVYGPSTGYEIVTGIYPYKIISTTEDSGAIWDTDPDTGYVYPAVPFIWASKTKKWDALKELTTYLRRMAIVKPISDGQGGYYPGLYWIRQSQIDDATQGLDLPAAVSVVGPTGSPPSDFLDGPITLAQQGDNQVERVHVACTTLSGAWCDAILPQEAMTGPFREYYDEPDNVATQTDLNNLCTDLWTIYQQRAVTYTATFIQRPDIQLYQLLTVAGFDNSVLPAGSYRIVKIQYNFSCAKNTTQVWFQPNAVFLAMARLGWTYTDSIIETQRIIAHAQSQQKQNAAGTVQAVNSDGSVTVQTDKGPIVIAQDPSA